jgi:hypothetical protein
MTTHRRRRRRRRREYERIPEDQRCKKQTTVRDSVSRRS